MPEFEDRKIDVRLVGPVEVIGPYAVQRGRVAAGDHDIVGLVIVEQVARGDEQQPVVIIDQCARADLIDHVLTHFEQDRDRHGCREALDRDHVLPILVRHSAFHHFHLRAALYASLVTFTAIASASVRNQGATVQALVTSHTPAPSLHLEQERIVRWASSRHT